MKNWLLHSTKMNRLYINLGMISHKKSLMTNFGLKHCMQKFHQKFVLVHIWYEIANFEAKLPHKMFLLKYSRVYIILFLL